MPITNNNQNATDYRYADKSNTSQQTPKKTQKSQERIKHERSLKQMGISPCRCQPLNNYQNSSSSNNLLNRPNQIFR